jgi:hypothetical protein
MFVFREIQTSSVTDFLLDVPIPPCAGNFREEEEDEVHREKLLYSDVQAETRKTQASKLML